MTDFETKINDAVAAQEVPGCALVSTSRDGSFYYAKAFGSTSMKPSNAKPMQLDTVMWFASCTKLMTAICAMQLVERGQLNLDDPVYDIIPELRSRTVITGLTDARVPIEEPHKKTITLRHLMSHSSGLTYDHIPNEKISAWLEHNNLKPLIHSKTILERCRHPLTFEPGEAWAYGPGIDFAGLMVERVTGMSLGAYMKKNLWDPLGMRDVTFHPSTRPDMQARLADMSLRSEDGKVVHADGLMVYVDENGKEFEECIGGHGSFATAEEYIKVLRAVLVCGAGGGEHGGGILKKESVDELTKSQLSEASKKYINALRKHPLIAGAAGNIPESAILSWSLGGLLLLTDCPDGRRAGTMIWGGLPNLTWFIDQAKGLAGVYAGQVIPANDAKCGELSILFGEGVYKMYDGKV